MKRLAIRTALAASLMLSASLSITPARSDELNTAGAATALGDVCAALIRLPFLLTPRSSTTSEEDARYNAALNTAIELGYSALAKIVKQNTKTGAAPVPGDTALGHMSVAVAEIQTRYLFSSDDPYAPFAFQVADDMDAACRQMLETGKLVWPAGYPYTYASAPPP